MELDLIDDSVEVTSSQFKKDWEEKKRIKKEQKKLKKKITQDYAGGQNNSINSSIDRVVSNKPAVRSAGRSR